jgi:hypothetical protein
MHPNTASLGSRTIHRLVVRRCGVKNAVDPYKETRSQKEGEVGPSWLFLLNHHGISITTKERPGDGPLFEYATFLYYHGEAYKEERDGEMEIYGYSCIDVVDSNYERQTLVNRDHVTWPKYTHLKWGQDLLIAIPVPYTLSPDSTRLICDTRSGRVCPVNGLRVFTFNTSVREPSGKGCVGVEIVACVRRDGKRHDRHVRNERRYTCRAIELWFVCTLSELWSS